MSVFSHPEFDAHELVAFHADPESGLRAIIALHNTRLGVGLGGCRVLPYATEEEALTDVLRLSRGMTYKAALAGLDQGGGKSVIWADPRTDKTPAMMRAMGRFVDSLGGKYVVAEDSGTTEFDMREISLETRYVGGDSKSLNPADPGDRDTSAATALGVFIGIQASVQTALKRSSLQDVRVAIQGVGKVGSVLAGHLHEAGARLFVADTHAPGVEKCVKDFGATAVPVSDLFAQDVDVVSPCALGAVINDRFVSDLKARIVAGAANNQLAEARHGQMLRDKGVLYAPDYAINAGGIINLYYSGNDRRWSVVERHIRQIGDTLKQIFEEATRKSCPTDVIADELAERRFRIS